MEIFEVVVSKRATKDLMRVPQHVVVKLQAWCHAVGLLGLRSVQKIIGYHDEPLKGKRFGQRSIRLNKAYRALYRIDVSGVVDFIEIVEVNKHDY